jgi:hypothetical protein
MMKLTIILLTLSLAIAYVEIIDLNLCYQRAERYPKECVDIVLKYEYPIDKGTEGRSMEFYVKNTLNSREVVFSIHSIVNMNLRINLHNFEFNSNAIDSIQKLELHEDEKSVHFIYKRLENRELFLSSDLEMRINNDTLNPEIFIKNIYFGSFNKIWIDLKT